MNQRYLALIFIVLLCAPSVSMFPSAEATYATGGTITGAGGKRIHTFTTSGTFTVVTGGDVEVLVVGGGGGTGGTGTQNYKGAGGAGGLLYSASYAVVPGAMTVTIGAGGAPNANGGWSKFGTLNATGGGKGGDCTIGAGTPPNIAPGSGGSGGGGGHVIAETCGSPGGSGTGGQGNAGAAGSAAPLRGGGGGGAGAAAAGATGGIGLQYSINGTAIYYAGGGGGGGDLAGDGGAGGNGGGGNGVNFGGTGTAQSGRPNSGGGAGGGDGVATGGSGVVIISYTAPPPNSIDDLTADDFDTESVDLSWSAPNLNGGTLQRYTLNYTTPCGTPLTALPNGTTATSYTVSGLASNTCYSFRASAATGSGYNVTGANIVNVTTLAFNQANFTVGSLSFDADNPDVIPIFFERTDINSTSLFLNVTYPSTWELACDFHYKFAMTNQTYNNLTSSPVGTTNVESSFELIGADNEVINVRCWDRNGTGEGRYLITQTNFPLFQYITKFSNGHYGTSGDFATFDFVYLAVIIVSLVGLNRTNESVGAGFMIVITAAMAYFHFITIPTAAISGIGLAVMLIIITTRKD